MQHYRLSLISFIFICFSSLEAKCTYGNLCIENVVRVHDGDTFIVDIADVHPIIGKSISVRIKGIDTPEIYDKRPLIQTLAKEARNYVALRLQNTQIIELINVQRDKYFRLLADVYVDGINLADELIQLGFAQTYDGGTKPTWE